MSTFGGLNTAYSGLVAARQGLDTVGQNIANANTVGYTRQRITTSAISAPTSVFSTGVRPGLGVSVDGIARLGDASLDARVRATSAVAGYSTTRADALSALETTLQEPGTNGISAQLQTFWAAWQDMSNGAGQTAPASAVLAQAGVLTAQISAGYSAVDAQWTDLRAQAGSAVVDVNSAASTVADLNRQIRTTLAAGGSANELIDQRSVLTTQLATAVGATVRDNGDGTIDVVLGGNALVSGTDTRQLQLAGATGMSGAGSDPVRLEWAGPPASAAGLDGGHVAGILSLLAPADATRTGGALAEAAASYNGFAKNLADQVNAAAATVDSAGNPVKQDFFSYDTTGALGAAASLRVIPTDASGLPVGPAGALDGSVADRISQLGISRTSPDTVWSAFVTGIGGTVKTALQQSSLADLSASSASTMQLSNASVDLDEENVNLLTFQHAYQGAARVMTAVDEMLDTLINRTGRVGL